MRCADATVGEPHESGPLLDDLAAALARGCIPRRHGASLAIRKGCAMTDLTITPLRVAFIGAGNMARLHLQALRRRGIPPPLARAHDARSPTPAECAPLASATAPPTRARLPSRAAAPRVHGY